MPLKRVSILIERHVGYRLSVLRGIFQYARKADNWVCQGSELREETLEMLRRLRPRPDGIIAGLWHLNWAEDVAKLGFPIVDVFDWHQLPNVSRVTLDNGAVGETAAKYFLSRGFRDVAYLGHPLLRFSVERRRGFEAVMAANGVSVRVAPPSCSEGDVWPTSHHTARRGPLLRWVRSLPKPIAVFCTSDGWATQLTDACHLLHLEVPHQVAVLGVDNDELLCPLSRPPLSSIDTAAERVGYQAAALLDRIMNGQTATSEILIPPGLVVERQSTDVLRVEDPDVAMALRFIRENSHLPLRIDQIAEHVIMPRRTLQRRFREVVGHGLSEEVTRCRLDQAKRLLVETNLSIPQIASRCGFASRERFSASFRKGTDSTPAQFRRHYRPGAAS